MAVENQSLAREKSNITPSGFEESGRDNAGGGSPNRAILSLSLCLLVITGLAARLNLMTLSLWEDEAWVANSALSPSLGEMFHYSKWLQTSPPLFLLLLRGSTTIFGRSEAALRLAPWLAGAASVVLVGIALTRLFPAALALLGTVFFLTNYWAVKYSQQVKQYTADLLVSSLFLFLLLSYLGSGQKRRIFWALVLAGGVGIFFSYATIFWFPVALLAIAIHAPPADTSSLGIEATKEPFRIRLVRSVIALAAYLTGLGLVDLFFIRSNRSPSLVDFWKDDFIGSGGLLRSMARFLVTCCDLMAPQRFTWSRPLSYAFGLAVLAALVRGVMAAIRGDSKAQSLLFVTGLPVLVALVMSAFRQYPLLTYPRMIIWILPLCTVLLVYAAELLWMLVTAKIGAPASTALVAGLALFVCGFAAYFNLFVVPRSNGQDARSAISYLKNNARPQDPLFVRGVTVEQVTYYSESLHWQPQSLYVGNTNLPCCLRTQQVVPPRLADLGFAQDIHSFADLATGKQAWFLLDRGAYQKVAGAIGDEMSSAKCRSVEKKDFENLALLRFDCTSATAAGAQTSTHNLSRVLLAPARVDRKFVVPDERRLRLRMAG